MPVNLREKIPTTLDEAVDIIVNGLDNDEREFVKTDGAAVLHFSAGMAIRNEWGLWHGSELAQWFNKLGIHHADDMSGLILTKVTAIVQGIPFDLDLEVQRYKTYWKEQLDD